MFKLVLVGGMLYAVSLLKALCVIKTVKSTHKVACYSADTLEWLGRKVICAIYVFPVNVKIYCSYSLIREFFQCCLNIGVYLALRQCSVCYVYLYHSFFTSYIAVVDNSIIHQYIVYVNCYYAQYHEVWFVHFPFC